MVLARAFASLILMFMIIGAVAVYLSNVKGQPTLDTFTLDTPTAAGPSRMAFSGTLSIKNPLSESIPVTSINYTIYLQDSGETIANGTMPAFTLKPNNVTTEAFAQNITWAPSSSVMDHLLSQPQVFLRVNGTAYLDMGKGRVLPVQFTAKTDARDYVQSAYIGGTQVQSAPVGGSNLKIFG